ncbi:MAG: alpha/beta hydrolase [Opitutaceae bacterium]|nr:alpha/beta hydrolase [Opitutaceae bacterium]
MTLESRTQAVLKCTMPRFAPAALLSLALSLISYVQAAESGPRVLKDLTFLAPNRAEKLDVYLPATLTAGTLAPAVVWIHGGGWTGGTKNETRAAEICATLAAAGYVAVSIDYRLGDGAWPTNLHDCKNAVRFLRAHAAEYHIDPKRIAVAGGSAGGHLALMTGLTADQAEFEPTANATPYPGVSSQVRCIIDLYGPASLLTRLETDAKGVPNGKRKPGGDLKVFGAASIDDPVFALASPVSHVAKNAPPVLIIHGLIDGTVDIGQSWSLAGALVRKGVEHEFILVEGAGHTFDFEFWNKKSLSRDLRPVALAFLNKHLAAR